MTLDVSREYEIAKRVLSEEEQILTLFINTLVVIPADIHSFDEHFLTETDQFNSLSTRDDKHHY